MAEVPAGVEIEALVQRIENRQAVVGVVGLGYVGLPLVHAICDSGFKVIGFDVDPAKIEQLAAGQSYIAQIPGARIAEFNASGKFQPTSDFALLQEVDAVLICVPTPLSDSRDPDLSYVESTARAISHVLRGNQLVILESTTYPGTTKDVVVPVFSTTGVLVQECPDAWARTASRESPWVISTETGALTS